MTIQQEIKPGTLGVPLSRRREPTDKDFADPRFDVIWELIKRVDVDFRNGLFSGATGNDVCAVLDALDALDAGAAALSRQREQEEISRATLQPQQSISSPDPRGDDRDGSGLKDYAAYLERIHADDYLAYAARHLRSALLKASDAPCSAAQHERQARLALELGRVPNQTEAMDWASDAPRDPEKWPCSFSHHVHATREEAVECARKRTTVQQSAALSQPSRQLEIVTKAQKWLEMNRAHVDGVGARELIRTLVAALVPQGWEVASYLLHEDEHGMNTEAVRMRQRDGRILWAVRHGSKCLNRAGEWEYEPQPSSRDEAFFARCRFDSAEDARTAYTNRGLPAPPLSPDEVKK